VDGGADHLGGGALVARFDDLKELLREVWWQRFHAGGV